MGALNDKTAVITGAAQGIGARLAQGLAAQGARVVIADVLDGASVVDSIRSAGGEALACETDITNDDALAHMVAEAEARFGAIDVLVNNAALFGHLALTSIEALDYDEWDRVMRVNVRGVLQSVRAVLPSMRRRGSGSIVNITSNRIYRGFPGLLHYDASKGAVSAMTKSMAMELGDAQIRVNAIAPGLTMSESVQNKSGIEARNDLVVQGRALKRTQQPDDLVGAVVFFASDQSGFVSGQTMIVDGGGIVL